MIEERTRPAFQRLFVDRVAKRLSIHPNTITLASLGTGLLSALLIALNFPLFALLFLLLSGYLDSLDGTVARLTKKSSPFGTVLDIVCDRIVEFAVIFAFFYRYQAPYASLLMSGSVLVCVTSFLVVSVFLDEKSEKSFTYSSGLMERAEAFVFFSAMILFPSAFLPLAFLFTFLVFSTAFLRVLEFAKRC